jgi:two-component system, OmpR family, response regulator MtrA
MTDRILVIEDDERLGAQIVEHLRKAGFETLRRSTGELILPGSLPGFSLLVLDLMLPGKHGLDILKHLRTYSEVPVLVLSARDSSADKVRAFKLGADDYLTKPFWPEELIERVRARLRRPAMQRGEPLRFGGLELDLGARQASMQGRPVELTRVEFDLLAALAQRAGEAVTRKWLADNVLDPDKEGTERTLDVHVSRLRKKLEGEELIETVWGIGYRLRGGAPR